MDHRRHSAPDTRDPYSRVLLRPTSHTRAARAFSAREGATRRGQHARSRNRFRVARAARPSRAASFTPVSPAERSEAATLHVMLARRQTEPAVGRAWPRAITTRDADRVMPRIQPGSTTRHSPHEEKRRSSSDDGSTKTRRQRTASLPRGNAELLTTASARRSATDTAGRYDTGRSSRSRRSTFGATRSRSPDRFGPHRSPLEGCRQTRRP